MGALGGVIYLGVAAVMYPNSKVEGLAHVNYQPLFMVVSAIMFVAIAVLFLTIKEPKLVAEQQKLEAQHPEWNLAEDDGSGSETLPKPVKKSLIFLLSSISLWFLGYNAVETWFTTYVSQVMGQALGGASTCLLIATGGAVISYIPIGVIASKVGRKRTIMAGIILLAVCFGLGYFLTTAYSEINVVMFIVFALVGLAWAAINVNSLPMVVEMCRGSDIGKFTGYYYTFSMVAQVVTPIVAGSLMRHISYTVLFPYAALFVALSFVTMIFVKHGDNKPEAKRGLDAFEEAVEGVEARSGRRVADPHRGADSLGDGLLEERSFGLLQLAARQVVHIDVGARRDFLRIPARSSRRPRIPARPSRGSERWFSAVWWRRCPRTTLRRCISGGRCAALPRAGWSSGRACCRGPSRPVRRPKGRSGWDGRRCFRGRNRCTAWRFLRNSWLK